MVRLVLWWSSFKIVSENPAHLPVRAVINNTIVFKWSMLLYLYWNENTFQFISMTMIVNDYIETWKCNYPTTATMTTPRFLIISVYSKCSCKQALTLFLYKLLLQRAYIQIWIIFWNCIYLKNSCKRGQFSMLVKYWLLQSLNICRY